MAKANRKTLKGYFGTGRMPTGKHFEDLVDSMLNIVDDGLNTTENGLQLAPREDKASVIEFYDRILDEHPLWQIEVDKPEKKLQIRRGGEGAAPLVVLCPDGRIEIAGDVCLSGKIEARAFAGAYRKGEVPADGRWHDITEEEEGVCALRVMAACGRKGMGKYAVAEVVAMHCFGHRRRIRPQASWYGMVFNRLGFRWAKKGPAARLQVRTRCDYGGGTMIRYEITQLWHG